MNNGLYVLDVEGRAAYFLAADGNLTLINRVTVEEEEEPAFLDEALDFRKIRRIA